MKDTGLTAEELLEKTVKELTIHPEGTISASWQETKLAITTQKNYDDMVEYIKQITAEKQMDTRRTLH